MTYETHLNTQTVINMLISGEHLIPAQFADSTPTKVTMNYYKLLLNTTGKRMLLLVIKQRC